MAIVVADAVADAGGGRRAGPRGSLPASPRELRSEVAKVDNVGLTYIVGEQPEQIRVEPDPEKLRSTA